VNTIKKYDESRPLEVFSDEEEKNLFFSPKVYVVTLHRRRNHTL
jgi:hypothetical protein